MTIQRVPAVPFTQIANSVLRDTRLSYKARGLLAMVLSHSGEWEATTAWLVEQSEGDGITAVQSALNELTALGYRVVQQEHGRNGRIHTVVSWYHTPHLDAQGEPLGTLIGTALAPRDRTEVSRSPEKPGTGKTDHRKTRAPSRTQLPRTQEEPEQQETTRPPGIKADPEFDAFWAIYPRRVAKLAARKAWTKATRLATAAEIIAGAERYRDDPGRTDRYTAHPASWLNAGRWTDDPTPTPTRSSLAQLPIWEEGDQFAGGSSG